MKVKASEIEFLVAEGLRKIIQKAKLNEKAPPGDEDKVMALKKSFRQQHPEWSEDRVKAAAFATAWKQHGTEESVYEMETPAATAQTPAGGQQRMAMMDKRAATGQAALKTTPQDLEKEVDAAFKKFGMVEEADTSATSQQYAKMMQFLKQRLPGVPDADLQKAVSAHIAKQSMQQTMNAHSAAQQAAGQPALVEGEGPTKITVSEFRNMIRKSLKEYLAEAFGIGGEDGPTGGFESEKLEGKKETSGTFGDGGQKEGPLSENIEISSADLKEEIKAALKEMQLSFEDDEEVVKEASAVEDEMQEEAVEEAAVRLEEGSLWGYKLVDVASGASILVKEEAEFPSLARAFGWEGSLIAEAEAFLDENVNKVFADPGYFERLNEGKKKPSAGLTKKEKSAVVKKAKAGKDIGKKGKGFKKVEKKAKESGAEDPKAVAAAAMWKAKAAKKKEE